jgi:hypothetical protein
MDNLLGSSLLPELDRKAAAGFIVESSTRQLRWPSADPQHGGVAPPLRRRKYNGDVDRAASRNYHERCRENERRGGGGIAEAQLSAERQSREVR